MKFSFSKYNTFGIFKPMFPLYNSFSFTSSSAKIKEKFSNFKLLLLLFFKYIISFEYFPFLKGWTINVFDSVLFLYVFDRFSLYIPFKLFPLKYMKSFVNVNLEGIIWIGVPISIFIMILFFLNYIKYLIYHHIHLYYWNEI